MSSRNLAMGGRNWAAGLAVAASLLGTCNPAVPAERPHQAPKRLEIPLGLDAYLPVPEDNPLSSEKVGLGRRLFLDRRLSRDNSIACATCHDPGRAFTDGRWCHGGSISTPEGVMEFYDRGGNPNAYLDPELRPLRVTAEEKHALAAFLRTLSGTIREGMLK